ncbi:SOS response-associated peptidase [Longispora sp. NPDC051575]|uniref:SOS response-associated peptidase n=1 Tax=Longispora sp. NPDC051575 TaxID=3154943 RepID=UPI00343A1AA3
MCGRYVSRLAPEAIVEEFGVDRVAVSEVLEPDFNVAPTKQVYAVLDRIHEDHPERQLRSVRWGLVPSWAKDVNIGRKLINARLESADEKPAYRKAWEKRRAILPADGFYEWTPEKTPFYLHRPDDGVLALAALYELWRDPALPKDDPDAWLWSAVVLTTVATDEAGKVHDRAPLVVPAAAYDAWLSPAGHDSDALRALLVPATSLVVADEVSREVNNVRNNGPSLITRVA